MMEPIEHAVEIVGQRLMLARTPKDQLRILWAGAKAARRIASSDDVSEKFSELAEQAGLTLGRARGDVAHVLRWAARGMNPFDRGPLYERD